MIKPKKAAAKKPVKRKTAAKKKVATSVKQKFKTGEFVYSYLNPSANREIATIQRRASANRPFVYRLKLCDSKGKLKLSAWIMENFLTKTKRAKYKNPKDL